jgi:hypothetical protein
LHFTASFLAHFNAVILKKHLFATFVPLLFCAILVIFTPSCSRKSGCPAEDAQTQVDKYGRYKASKTKSGLGLVPKKSKKKKKR